MLWTTHVNKGAVSWILAAACTAAPEPTVPMGLPIVDAQPQALSAPQKFAECAICFEPLHAGPVGAFIGPNGRRVSNHYFNLNAATQWMASGNGSCPLTRKPIQSVISIPNVLSDPIAWFRAVDIDQDGRLNRAEVLDPRSNPPGSPSPGIHLPCSSGMRLS